jgi:hypothetical protein
MSSSNLNNRSADSSDEGSDNDENNNNNNVPFDDPNDSKHYDGVYYGSSDDDDTDTDIDITDALLGDIGEPDENEEPYDILADNGEFLYSEEDQRPYVATTSLGMMSAAEGATSPIMMSISEEEEEEEEEGERILEAAEEKEEETATGTRSREYDSTSKSRVTVFHAGSGAKTMALQPRPVSPPTPMYQMPIDYSIRSKTHSSNKRDNSGESENESEGASESDSEDERSSSSSMVAGSIKQLVRDIDGVLNDMRPEGSFDSDDQTDRVVNSSYIDDATITSDVSVGALTRLSGELDRAQEHFMMEFTGIDATGFRGPHPKKKGKKKKKKKIWLQQPQPSVSPTSPSGEDTDDNSNGYRRTIGDTKMSTVVKLFASYAIFIGVLVVIYIMTRNGTNTETSINSSISNDPIPSVLITTPTLSPVTDNAFAGDPISLNPEAVTPAPSSNSSRNNINANANADTIMPTVPKSTLTPSLRPSKRSQKSVSQTAAPTKNAKSSTPTPTPTLPETIPPTTALTQKTNSFAPIPTPTLFTNLPTLPISGKLNGTHDENETERTQSPAHFSSAKANDETEETEDKNDGEHSFEVPDSSDFQPNEFMGEDDFYSNDSAYEYENHHPNGDEYEKDSKYSKQEKHNGNLKVEKAHATKKDKALKGPKQPKQRQWQEINPTRPSPTIVRESATRIRKRRNVPHGN